MSSNPLFPAREVILSPVNAMLWVLVAVVSLAFIVLFLALASIIRDEFIETRRPRPNGTCCSKDKR